MICMQGKKWGRHLEIETFMTIPFKAYGRFHVMETNNNGKNDGANKKKLLLVQSLEENLDSNKKSLQPVTLNYSW